MKQSHKNDNPRAKDRRKSRTAESLPPDFLRPITESAEHFGIARTTLFELVGRGEIGYVRLKPNGERKVPDSEVRAWIERSKVRSERSNAA